MCILNHTTRAADVEEVLTFLESAEPTAARSSYDRHAQLPATVSLFTRLDTREAQAFRQISTERLVAAGTAIVERWDTSRDLYVLEDGLADVMVNGDLVSTLRPGDYFGEIAALEWGAGFARSRAATVVAREAVRVRVLAPDGLERLLAAFPRLEDELRRTAHERLRRAR
jgi:cAMP-dependent protein kinase regulator/CRP/FNR family cyclic AMP-dependent transcriptional regulator/cGMP-dependent protein kinase 2